jgi:hypothetical protein
MWIARYDRSAIMIAAVLTLMVVMAVLAVEMVG